MPNGFRSLSLIKQRCGKVKTCERTKLQMVWHIRRLFKSRRRTSRAARWDCVLRGGKLILMRAFLVDPPTDKVILNCFLEPGQLPSLLSIYQAVRKNWPTLAQVNIKEEAGPTLDGSFPAGSDVGAQHEEQCQQADCVGFPNLEKPSLKKKIA